MKRKQFYYNHFHRLHILYIYYNTVYNEVNDFFYKMNIAMQIIYIKYITGTNGIEIFLSSQDSFELSCAGKLIFTTILSVFAHFNLLLIFSINLCFPIKIKEAITNIKPIKGIVRLIKKYISTSPSPIHSFPNLLII